MSVLEDFIAIYPPQYHRDIQGIISNKQEFIQLSGKPREKVPERGEKYSHQEYFLRFMLQYDRIYKIDDPGSGKCMRYNTPILMYDGSIKPVQDIKNGEYIMGPDSKKRRVMGVTSGEAEMYEIIPAKGRSFGCNGPHILTLKGMKPLLTEVNRPSKYAVRYSVEGEKKSKAFKTIEEAEEFIEEIGEDIFDVPLEEYMQWSTNRKSKTYLFHVGIDFKSRSVPVDPYMIGYWLGDGDSCRSAITTADQEIVDYYTEELPKIDCQLNSWNDESGYHYSISGNEEKDKKGKKGGNHFLNTLKDTNMLNNKHIPDIYKLNSRRKRLKLLAGLIDSDGYKDPGANYYEITQKSKKLADDIEYLCFSLGFMVTMAKVTKGCPVNGKMVYGEYYRLNIFGDGLEDVPVLLDRKKCDPRFINKRATCQSFKIKATGEDKYYGFQLDGDGRFLLGDFLVTHNTCTMVGLAEGLKDYQNRFKHCYVLEKGPTTLHDFKNQIVCKCTKFGVYETEAIRRATDTKVRAANITNEIKSWYTVTTYTKFGSECDGMTEAQIKEKYSHCVFFIDEAHILRNTKGVHESKNASESRAGKEKISLQKAYRNIWKVCHEADNIKVVVASATPNINDVGDFVPTANLLLPKDRQLPYHIKDTFVQDKKDGEIRYDYRFVTLAQMEPFFRGIFSYARALDTGVDIINMGTNLGKTIELEMLSIYADLKPLITANKDGSFTYHKQVLPPLIKEKYQSQLIVYPVKMSPFQSLIFSRADSSGEYNGIQGKHHSAEFVFPDGSFGGNLDFFLSPEKVVSSQKKKASGMPKYVTRRGQGDYVANKVLKDLLASPEELYKHSCKFYEILQIEENNPLSKGFIFTDAFTGAGAILLSLMFEAHGYEKYDRSESSFQIDSDGKREIKIEKRKRYAILSNDSSTGKIPSTMEMFNDPINRDGGYIKIMIGAPVARDGVNFYDVMRAYLLRAGWHPAGDLQALYRILRAVSHEATKREKEKYYKEHGIEDEVRIPVQIYRMCSYTHPDIIKEGEREEKMRKRADESSSEEDEEPIPVKGKSKKAPSSESEILPVKSKTKKTTTPIKTKKIVLSPSSSESEVKPPPIKSKKIVLSSSSDEEIVVKKKPIKKPINSPSSDEDDKPTKSKGGYRVPTMEVKSLMRKTSEKFDFPVEECISIDMELYIKGEEKDIYNRRIMRIWKILAIDAVNNKARNILPEDKPGTIATDYLKDKFIPWSEDPRFTKVVKYDKPDYSTYDVLYSNKEVKEISDKIVDHLIEYGFLPIQKLLEKWVDSGLYREKLVWMALDILIHDHKEVLNRFGFPSFVSTDRQKYIYLQSDSTTDQKNYNDLMYYSHTMTGVVTTPLNEVLNEFLAEDQEGIIKEILSIKGKIDDEKGDMIEDYLSKLVLNFRVMLVEKILLAYMKTDKILEEELEEMEAAKTASKEKPVKETPKTPKTPAYKKKEESSLSEEVKKYNSPIKREPSPKVVSKGDSSSSITPQTVKVKVKTKTKKTDGISPEIIRYIMNRFQAYIYTDVLEPFADIDRMAKAMSKKVNGKTSTVKVVYSGRAKTAWANMEGVPYEKGAVIDITKSRRINRVYLHTLYTREEESMVSYKTKSRFANVDGLIRVLKPAEGLGWRDTSVYESGVYRELVREEMGKRMKEYGKFDVYGTLLADRQFRIVDKLKQRKGSKTDGRLVPTGSICPQMEKPEIVKQILNENALNEEINNVVLSTTDRKSMIQLLVSKFNYASNKSSLSEYTNDDLEFVLKIYESGAKRPFLCDFLRNKFKNEGRMLYAD